MTKEERVRKISPLSHAEVSEDVSCYTRDLERPLKHRQLMLIADVTRPTIICQQDVEKAVFRGCLPLQDRGGVHARFASRELQVAQADFFSILEWGAVRHREFEPQNQRE